MEKFIVTQEPNLNITPLSKERIIELSNYVLTLEELKQILDTIVYKTRMDLKEAHSLDITKDSLTGFCIEATDRICCGFGNYFDILPYDVHNILNKDIYHSFAVGRFDTIEGVKRYIIDITYRQFCLAKKDRSMPGHFFYNQSLLKSLLKDGYLEANSDNLVIYGASFVLVGEEFDKRSNPTLYEYEDYSHSLETGKMLVKRN